MWLSSLVIDDFYISPDGSKNPFAFDEERSESKRLTRTAGQELNEKQYNCS